ncbi:MAG: Uma2 family endonuclease [Chloroflexaceae bacterium]|nr:Uma2 family endonuclease [Chloroflexaceae bacterium]
MPSPPTLAPDVTALAHRHWTVAEVALLNVPDDTDVELLEGVLTMATRPHWSHQQIVGYLTWLLQSWIRQGGGHGTAIPEPGVIFDPNTALIPNVVWISAARVAAVLHSDGKLHGAPDLVIEVLSGGAESSQRDREAKREVYARAGVQEYWIVDRFTQTIEVYRHTDVGPLTLALTATTASTLTSPLLPGLVCRVAEVFLS